MAVQGENWDAERHEAIVKELAAQAGLPVTPALIKFYMAAYATAVFDIADEVNHGISRTEVINDFAPPKA